MSRVIVSLLFIAISSIFLYSSLNLPDANTGDPNQAKYFPAVISVFFLIVSIFLLIDELRKKIGTNETLKLLLSKNNFLIILSVIVISIIYSIIFELLGFLVSTIIFLIAILCLINGIKGWKKWLTNLSVSLIFSFVIWYSFNELLGVSLP